MYGKRRCSNRPKVAEIEFYSALRLLRKLFGVNNLPRIDSNHDKVIPSLLRGYVDMMGYDPL
jgi:hypothetical protein